jgi:hypothetical protein
MDIEPRFRKGDNVLIISSKRIGTVNVVMNRDNNIAYAGELYLVCGKSAITTTQ